MFYGGEHINDLRSDADTCFKNGLRSGDGQNEYNRMCIAGPDQVADADQYGAPDTRTPITLQHITECGGRDFFLDGAPVLIDGFFLLDKGFSYEFRNLIKYDQMGQPVAGKNDHYIRKPR